MIRNKGNRFISLSFKMLLFSLIITTIPMLVMGSLLYWKTSEIIKENEQTAMLNSLAHIGSNIQTIVNYIDDLSVILIQNNDVREWLQTSIKDESQLAYRQLAVEKQLTFSVGNKNYIASIQIEGLNGGTAFTGLTRQKNSSDEQVRSILDNHKGRLIWTYGSEQWKDENPGVKTLAMMRNINDINTGKKLGVLRIDILISALSSSFDSFIDNPMSKTLMVDQTGEIIVNYDNVFFENVLPIEFISELTSENKMIETKIGDIGYLTAIYNIPGNDWWLVNIIPTEYVLSNNDVIRAMLIISLIVSFSLCVLFAILFSRVFTKPLRYLTDHMTSRDILDAEIIKPPKLNDEVGILINTYNEMSSQLRTLVEETTQSKIALKESEFAALQNQINPHALYNNLDTAYWLSRLEDAPKTSEIIWAMSQLYRLSVGRKEEIITVKEELEYMDLYRKIYELRVEGDLRINYIVEKSLYPSGTIRFILQPLVENSILHGIQPKNGNGKIDIKIFVEDKKLIMEIQDDGVGADVLYLNSVLNGQYEVEENSFFAIRNVNERIKMRFGENYGLHYVDNPAGGLISIISQPIIDKIVENE